MTTLEYAKQEYLKRLTPTSLSELVGYGRLSAFLREHVEKARRSNVLISPTVFAGHALSDSADVASVVACELMQRATAEIHRIDGRELETPGEVAALVTNIDAGDALVVSMLESMPPSVRDCLLEATVNREFPVRIAEDPRAGETMGVELPPYHLLSTSTASRGVSIGEGWRVIEVRPRTDDELIRIAHWCAERLAISFTKPAAAELAGRSRGHAHRLRRLLVEVFVHGTELFAADESATVDAGMVERVLDVDGND